MKRYIDISEYSYDLPEERIAKFPLPNRDDSKLLVYRNGEISENRFRNLGDELPERAMLVFNNTKVVRARLVFFKETGARIEIFCLEPHDPSDYERAFAVKGRCEWRCMVGNLKKWKEGTSLSTEFETGNTGRGSDMIPHRLSATLIGTRGSEHIVRFEWDVDMTFGQLLETLGRIPIPPYLCRESEQGDTERYQTVYSKFEGSVAAPTAGLHFTPELISQLAEAGHGTGEVTLHVGAGTFLPVKSDNAAEHEMHTEHFEFSDETISNLLDNYGRIIAVGTTTVRTLESLAALGARVLSGGEPMPAEPVGQWEIYDTDADADAGGEEPLHALLGYMKNNRLGKIKAATRIMITPGYKFRVVNGMVTNFHQPKSTLLLLVSAMIGNDWSKVYDYALANDFRFLSYGDSSLLLP